MSLSVYLWVARVCGPVESRPRRRAEAVYAVKRILRYQSGDYRRRGQSNREGGNNRRWRRYYRETDWRGVLIWPDYALGGAL